MAHHIFQLETELQNIPEAAPKASRSFSVSEKLARYGSSALSGVELRRTQGPIYRREAIEKHYADVFQASAFQQPTHHSRSGFPSRHRNGGK
jgi:hypothetical protein